VGSPSEVRHGYLAGATALAILTLARRTAGRILIRARTGTGSSFPDQSRPPRAEARSTMPVASPPFETLLSGATRETCASESPFPA
jgi:hypothetical protein